ncbi:MAG TPA: hypothetical protein VEA38_07890, partial [Terriglobales bacterium]|nr:hypothetical protein [Terriglobales bacterium]
MSETERRLRDAILDFPPDGMDESADEAHRADVLGLLPPTPLSRSFLEDMLAPLSGARQGIVLDFLAKLGRAEVAEAAAAHLSSEAADERFYAA